MYYGLQAWDIPRAVTVPERPRPMRTQMATQATDIRMHLSHRYMFKAVPVQLAARTRELLLY